MSLPGSIPLTGYIAPTSVLDTFATHDSDFGRGDKHVSDVATRNAITEDRRKWGMLVHVYDDGLNTKTYQLKLNAVDNDITNNANWVVYASGGKLATDSLDLTALVTNVDGDKATNFTLSGSPLQGSYIMVDVNGKLETVGNGAKDKAFYFSGDSGATARDFDSIMSGDELYHNGSISGYELDTDDKISIYQLTT